jgi:hypothetical protein
MQGCYSGLNIGCGKKPYNAYKGDDFEKVFRKWLRLMEKLFVTFILNSIKVFALIERLMEWSQVMIRISNGY